MSAFLNPKIATGGLEFFIDAANTKSQKGKGVFCVGASGANSDAGEVSLYELDGTSISTFTSSDVVAGDKFGYHAYVGSGKICVGAPNDGGSYIGSAYIFDDDGTNEIKIINPANSASAWFGGGINIGQNRILINAPGDADNGSYSGAAYLYEMDGTFITKIKASDGAANDYFAYWSYGSSIGSDRIAIGSIGDADNGAYSGSVYLYDLDGSNEIKINQSDAAANDHFGYSVAIHDNKLVVGAPLKNTQRGAAYIYDLFYNTKQDIEASEIKITSSDGQFYDWFGNFVAIEDKIVVGALDDRPTGQGSPTLGEGAAYIYDLDGTNEIKIVAATQGAGDRFGNEGAIGNGKIYIGAANDDNNGSNSGSLSTFNYDGTSGGTLKDGTAAGDRYGLAVSVSLGNSSTNISNNGSIVAESKPTAATGPSYDSANKGSLIFDGTSQYITLGTQSVISGDFCVDMWVKPTSNDLMRLFSFGYNDAESAVLFRDSASPYNLKVIYRTSSTDTTYDSSYALPANNIYHICWDRSGATNTLYVNGESQHTFSDSTSLVSCTYDIGWATSENNSIAYFKGNLYQSKLYSQSLTSSQVLDNFSAARGRYGI